MKIYILVSGGLSPILSGVGSGSGDAVELMGKAGEAVGEVQAEVYGDRGRGRVEEVGGSAIVVGGVVPVGGERGVDGNEFCGP